jgi:hypothetical protein
MSIGEIAGVIAGVLALTAFVPYIIAILRGSTRPNRATWFIWTVVGLLLATSYYSSGAHDTLWVPVAYVAGPLVVAVLSIKFGEGGWTWLDRLCLFGAAASAPLWWLSGSPLIALVINLLIDALGALPTIRKSYYNPQGEDRTAWALGLAGATVNLFAIEAWSFEIAAYPVYMFVANATIAALVLVPRKQKNIGPS